MNYIYSSTIKLWWKMCQTEFFLKKFAHSKIRSEHNTNTYFSYLFFLNKPCHLMNSAKDEIV